MASPRIEIKLPKLKQVKVTKQDIANGQAGNSSWCPIACALRREVGALGEIWDVDVPGGSGATVMVNVPVFANGVEVSKLKATYTLDLGKKASAFITAFDDSEKVKPQVFLAKRAATPEVEACDC